MVQIVSPEAQNHYGLNIIAASPDTFKDFWPDVRGNYFFRSRRFFLDFMHSNGGRIFYVAGCPHARPPFILVGNWRSRADITALWHVKGEGSVKKRLVGAAASHSFESGSDRFVTKPLGEHEAEEYGRQGFRTIYRIVLLQKQLLRESGSKDSEPEVEIIRYKKRYSEDVLRLDATAFDDFWRLDAHTMEVVASSCYRNVFLLARSDGEVLGYAIGGANGRFGYLQRLGIHAGYHGKGVGNALTRSVISSLRSMGAASLLVNTQDDNSAALGLYRKLGFKTMPDMRFIMQCTPRSLERLQ